MPWDTLRHINGADISDKEPTGDMCHSALIDGHQAGYPRAIQIDVDFLSTRSRQGANELNPLCQYVLQWNYTYGEVRLSALSYIKMVWNVEMYASGGEPIFVGYTEWQNMKVWRRII